MEQIQNNYVVEIEGLRIHVTRKRVKNINFRVDRTGRACMSVPLHLSAQQIDELAQSHVDWFRDHMGRVEASQHDAPETWQSGETLLVWGRPVTLQIEEGNGPFGCMLQENTLVVRVISGSTPEMRAMEVECWLANELRARVIELLPACEARVGVRTTSVTLRRMKSRWGSCTAKKGSIRLNVALAECPPECLEMVLVHELCHILEPNHGPRFHALMDLHCPSWRVSRRWLNEHPPRGW